MEAAFVMNGTGVDKNITKGIEWYESAAALGSYTIQITA